MLLLYRDHISLQVYHTGSEVQITPPPGEFEADNFIHTFALGEELLARLFLNHAVLWSPKAQLRNFFIQRGWEVRDVENAPY